MATVVSVRPGRWDATVDLLRARDGIGLLILNGLVASRVAITGRHSAELLGPGDLLASWPSHTTMDIADSWTVLEHMQLAVLDRTFAQCAAAHPQIAIALAARVVQRARRMTIAIAIDHYPRIDDRLLLMLWNLASRFGTAGPEGVRLALPLSHRMLAELAAARRPSVSTALARLMRRQLVSPLRPGWMLHGQCPADLRGLRRPATPQAPPDHATIGAGGASAR